MTGVLSGMAAFVLWGCVLSLNGLLWGFVSSGMMETRGEVPRSVFIGFMGSNVALSVAIALVLVRAI